MSVAWVEMRWEFLGGSKRQQGQRLRKIATKSVVPVVRLAPGVH